MVLLLLALTSCAGGAAEDRPAAPGSTTSTTAADTRELEAPTAWSPSAAETQPGLKRAAAEVVQVLATYPAGGGTTGAAQARLGAAGFSPDIAVAAGGLLDAQVASSATVVYPQLGGLTPSRASVMVVTEVQTMQTPGQRRVATRVVDVRLEQRAGRWVPVAVASDGTGPPPVPTVGAAATSVLSNENLRIPDTAIADVRAGRIDERLLRLLDGLAADRGLSVAVLSTGHPLNVFETERISNHTAGRGVDIWAINGVPIIEQQQSDDVRAVVAEALALGATEVGAPFDDDGRGGHMFTNEVHLDHLHLAFRAG